MTGLPATWIYLGECPVCVNGLARIRCCTNAASANSDCHEPAKQADPNDCHHSSTSGDTDCSAGKSAGLYAMCDECEAIWLQPDIATEHFYPPADSPRCPLCDDPLFGNHARWANTEDILSTVWEANCIVRLVDGDAFGVEAENEYISFDDQPIALDAPPFNSAGRLGADAAGIDLPDATEPSDAIKLSDVASAGGQPASPHCESIEGASSIDAEDDPLKPGC